jgi:hypothetical protein
MKWKDWINMSMVSINARKSSDLGVLEKSGLVLIYSPLQQAHHKMLNSLLTQ